MSSSTTTPTLFFQQLTLSFGFLSLWLSAGWRRRKKKEINFLEIWTGLFLFFVYGTGDDSDDDDAWHTVAA